MRIYVAIFLSCFALPLWADKLDYDLVDLGQLSLADLVEVKITTPSGTQETALEAPATMLVITEEDIRKRGYTDLPEIVADLPGFDVVIANGTSYMMAYQRGYRTTYTSRTLFMIDGIEENLLWSHEAAITRQYPLSNIKRIEVLYGPASAVYGPNAFLGIINIITKNADNLEENNFEAEMNMLGGSYNTRSLDATLRARPTRDLAFSLTARQYWSEEPDFSGEFGYLQDEQFRDSTTWGPLLNLEHQGRQLGHYYDPTDDYAVFADLRYKDFKLGISNWRRKEAYGPYYAADRVQNNAYWNKSSEQYFLEHQTELSSRLKSESLLLYRRSRRYGLWAEAEPDWHEGMEDSSYVSFTHWNSDSNSWLFKQGFEWELNEKWLFSSGLKYERKQLTKAYDVPGYWEAAISSTAPSGSGIVHSSEPVYVLPPPPGEMPDYNLAHTRDIGGYTQFIGNLDAFRLSLGLRYDKNSMYGSVITPRASLIYQPGTHSKAGDKTWTYKLLYGEAFQEPAPLQLWGGWSGRQANTALRPEKARNLEGVIIYRGRNALHELSVYRAHYRDVIKEEAENAGERSIHGLEYRLKRGFDNFIPRARPLDLYFYYTHTRVVSSVYYDHDTGTWLEGEMGLGDIAPHQFNLGLNLPLGGYWNLNLRGQWNSRRELYLRNPLRGQDQDLGGYFLLHGAFSYLHPDYDLTFKVLNLLDRDYLHPGVELASSGDEFGRRSLGYQNSLIPQPGRSFWLNLRLRF